MSKILHLIPDEKFTNDVITNFDLVTDNNLFIVFGDKSVNKFNVKSNKNILWLNDVELSRYSISLDVKAVVVHSLNYDFSKFLLGLRNDIKICWFVWGYDIYSLPKIQQTLYGFETTKYLHSKNRLFKIVHFIKKRSFLRQIYYRLFLNKPDYFLAYERAHKRINYFCTYIKEDFEVFNTYYPNKIEFFEIGYFSLNQYLGKSFGARRAIEGKNILVGNSNSIENNHFDLFAKLKKFSNQIDDNSIICPLNYNGNQTYKKDVCKLGEKLFQNKFKPLLDFLSRDEYVDVLKSCSTAIFYHYRQQAMGNIIALLYLGCRVYLSKNNPVYAYLKRISINVYDFDNDFGYYLNSPLTPDEALNNRLILETTFSSDNIIKQTNGFVKFLIDEF